jgi:hypothetical protein
MGSEQAQVVVRLVPGVVEIEAVEEFQDVVRVRADQFTMHRLDTRFILVRELRLVGWDPQRPSAAVVCYPDRP